MKYLRPRRGKKASATNQQLVLKKGEIFFEVPDNGTGKGVGKIKMGDGVTQYGNLPYFFESEVSTASESPITFTEVSSDDNTSLLNTIKTGAKLNTIIPAIKRLLFNLSHQNNIKYDPDTDSIQVYNNNTWNIVEQASMNYLYNSGNTYDMTTGGFVKRWGNDNATIANTGGKLVITGYGSGNNYTEYTTFGPTNFIDLRNVESLIITYDADLKSTDNLVNVGISEINTSTQFMVSKTISGIVNETNKSITIDVSELDGGYLMIQEKSASNATVFKISSIKTKLFATNTIIPLVYHVFAKSDINGNGEPISNAESGSNYTYYAFDLSDSTRFTSGGATNNPYVGYMFNNTVSITKVELKYFLSNNTGIKITSKLQYMDGTGTWIDVAGTEETTTFTETTKTYTYNITELSNVHGIRFICTSDATYCTISTNKMKIYGKLKNSASILTSKLTTSNTGENGYAVTDGGASGHDAYVAFNLNSKNGYFISASAAKEHYVGYMFNESTDANKARFQVRCASSSVTKTILYKIQYYNGSSWVDTGASKSITWKASNAYEYENISLDFKTVNVKGIRLLGTCTASSDSNLTYTMELGSFVPMFVL